RAARLLGGGLLRGALLGRGLLRRGLLRSRLLRRRLRGRGGHRSAVLGQAAGRALALLVELALGLVPVFHVVAVLTAALLEELVGPAGDLIGARAALARRRGAPRSGLLGGFGLRGRIARVSHGRGVLVRGW